MFEHVVVIVDGSKTSNYAIEASCTIAREVQGDITFCLSIDPGLSDEGVGLSFAQLARQCSESMLAEALRRAKAAGVERVSGRILNEDPQHAVVETARERGSDLIMMGLEPRIGILRPFIRSLAEEILRETTIPLCLVRRPARGWLARRFLVPIVGDQLSTLAIDHSIKLAHQFQAKLIFCSVEHGTDNFVLKEALEDATRRATSQGLTVEEMLLPSDDGIPNAIARLADISACDAIVMASHMRQGIPRLLEGSVTASVTYASDVPVIILRRPEIEVSVH